MHTIGYVESHDKGLCDIITLENRQAKLGNFRLHTMYLKQAQNIVLSWHSSQKIERKLIPEL